MGTTDDNGHVQLATHREGDVVVVMIQAPHLDWSNSEALKTSLDGLLSAGGKLVLDLQAMAFVDSVGLSLFLSSLKKAREHQGDLKVAGLQRQVKTLFELVSLDRIIPTYHSWEEAVKAFSQPAN